MQRKYKEIKGKDCTWYVKGFKEKKTHSLQFVILVKDVVVNPLHPTTWPSLCI